MPTDFKAPAASTALPTETQHKYGVAAIPAIDMNDPGMVEAWFASGSYSHYEHYRKVVLASCREAIRARMALEGTRVSESRLEDLARLHDNYLEYLADTLEGRSIRETLIRQRMGL